MLNIETTVKVISLAIAVSTFAWGVYQFSVGQKAQAETRRIEASKPFLEHQLAMYKEASRLASTIATTADEKKKAEALDRYWSLYWGELALVEDARVEGAMVRFGEALKAKADARTVQLLALNLAHECRNSLAVSWGVPAWESPHWVKPTD